MIVGEARTANGTINIRDSVDYDGPMLDDVKFNLFSGSGMVSVHTPPDAGESGIVNYIEIGSWNLYSSQLSVKDDGKSPDSVAGDGWYTGGLSSSVYVYVTEPCNAAPSDPSTSQEDGGAIADSDAGATCTNPNAGHIEGQALTRPGNYDVLVRGNRTLDVAPYVKVGRPFRATLEIK
jgi:hypothetical protein